MNLRSWYRKAEDERRIAIAQSAVWIAGLVPVLALGYVFAEIALGHPQQRPSIQVQPIQVALAGAWLTLYGVAGYLIGERRAAGGVLGFVLFGGTLVLSVVRGGVLNPGVALSLVGIALIVRAGRALRRPLFSTASERASTPAMRKE